MKKIVVRRVPMLSADAVANSTEPGQAQAADVSSEVEPAPQKKRKLFVHIGMFKTGTTSIQYYLHANMQRLNTAGILYPSTGRHPRAHVQHALIAEAFAATPINAGDFALRVPVDGPLILSALRHEINLSGMQTIILSSESLCALPEAGVLAFGEAFRDFDIVPIIYLRNFCDLADAAYQTAVMHNATTKTFREMGFADWGSSFSIVDICRNWSKLAHDGKILVQNYDDPEHDNSIVSFTRLVGINTAQMDNSQISAALNSSVSATQVVIKRELSNAGIDRGHIDGLVAQLQKLPMTEKQTMVPPDARPELTRLYLKQLEALAESGFVTGLKITPQMLTDDGRTEKVFVANIYQAVFALGRAIARAKFADK
jgi:hypothetical protein